MHQNIKYYRKKRGISIRKLARMAGISPSHVERLESGESIPRIDTALNVAAALHVPLSLLYSRMGTERRTERRGEMKSREDLIAEIVDVVSTLTRFGIYKVFWFAMHIKKYEK